jgi:hypothetical protein
MVYWDAAAVLIGAVLGILMGIVWRRIVSRDRGRRFYRQIGGVFHSMLTDPDADFLKLYKTLILKTGQFLGVQFLGILISLSPLIALFWFWGPDFHQWRNSKADIVSVRPREDAQLLMSDKGRHRTFKEGQVPIAALSSGNGFGVGLSGDVVLIRDARANNAICPAGDFKGVLLRLLGFDVSFVERAAFGPSPHLIVVRPWCGDVNPFWPYLSDPELSFWAGMGIFSVLAMFLFSPRTKHQQEDRQKWPGISFTDYMLVTIASAIPGVFRWLGDKESHCFRKSLGPIKIDRPIFVAGLARSGTTILLELLASLPSVATHQYRDFPFVMTPVLWHRFTAVFSSGKVAMERPHRDGIIITRESPEAFEEPLWQYFFPHVHRENVSSIINENNGDAEFAEFFADHIRKILLIRKGTRYLSKGNYNVTRIKYLASLFPDARFIIPVRHPIEHVRSLVGQHRLFQSYAEQDEWVPDYLRAAGHYEFGPQRVPICLQEGDSQRILDAWRLGREHIGYAMQWANIYRFVNELANGETSIADRILLVRYEDLCAYPREMLTRVFKFCDLDSGGIEAAASRIESGKVWTKDLDQDMCREIWEEVRDVAELYGYHFPISRTDNIFVLQD